MWIEVQGDLVYVFCLRKCTQAAWNVFDKIRFWMQQECYDTFTECMSCCEEFNSDQGIACGQGHFVCASLCFPILLQDQLQRIKQQLGMILCPICNTGFARQEIAKRADAESWKCYNDAAIEPEVITRCEQLEFEFDARLTKSGRNDEKLWERRRFVQAESGARSK